MGYGYTYTCDCCKKTKKRFWQRFDKKDKYENEDEYMDEDEFVIMLGSGMQTESLSQKYYKEAASGQYGEEWQELVKKHPQGKFDCNREVYKCTQCEFWDTYEKKAFYEIHYPDGAEEDYRKRMAARINPKYWDYIAEVLYSCPKCNQDMKRVNLHEESLICGKCYKKIKINFKSEINWD